MNTTLKKQQRLRHKLWCTWAFCATRGDPTAAESRFSGTNNVGVAGEFPQNARRFRATKAEMALHVWLLKGMAILLHILWSGRTVFCRSETRRLSLATQVVLPHGRNSTSTRASLVRNRPKNTAVIALKQQPFSLHER
ncbi:hypothetical protein AGIG_G14568 [Arapaima gigas]